LCPRAEISLTNRPPLNTAFVRKILSVDQALSDGEIEEAEELYIEAIEQFGTHYAKKAIMGSR